MTGQWVTPETRDAVIDFERCWRRTSELAADRFVAWIGSRPSQCYDWRARYGNVNEHKAWVPRDHWLTRRSGRRSSPIITTIGTRDTVAWPT